MTLTLTPREATRSFDLSFDEPISIHHSEYPGVTLTFNEATLTATVELHHDGIWRPKAWRDHPPFELEIPGAALFSFGKDGKPLKLIELLPAELRTELRDRVLTPWLDELNGNSNPAPQHGIAIEELKQEVARDVMAKLIEDRLGVRREEFLRALDAGEYAGTEDTDLLELITLAPFAR